METIYSCSNDVLNRTGEGVARERSVVLSVNGREMATLVASPHALRYLVAGFIRFRGLVETVDDITLLSICEDESIATVWIREDPAGRLRSVLAGDGVAGTASYLQDAGRGAAVTGGETFAPAAVFRLMETLAVGAEAYRCLDSIHSAAIGDGAGSLIVAAADINRHNTFDRIAGEALLNGLSLAGRMAVVSDRVSFETAAKAAHLGISLLASPASPTDLAITICRDRGITLIGDLKDGRFVVYSHPEGIETNAPQGIHRTIPAMRRGRGCSVTGLRDTRAKETPEQCNVCLYKMRAHGKERQARRTMNPGVRLSGRGSSDDDSPPGACSICVADVQYAYALIASGRRRKSRGGQPSDAEQGRGRMR